MQKQEFLFSLTTALMLLSLCDGKSFSKVFPFLCFCSYCVIDFVDQKCGRLIQSLPALHHIFEDLHHPSLSDHDHVDKDVSVMDRIAQLNLESALDFFEGDILVNNNVKDIVDMSEYGDIDGKAMSMMSKRNAERNRRKLWQDRKVPYEISPELSPHEILSAMDEFEKKTCLKFMPRTTENNWLIFVKETGCWSSIGRNYLSYGPQNVSIGNGCNSKGVIIHEIMHAIGFFHEQSRPDRNQYVEIFWENIVEGQSHNFNKYSRYMLDELGVQYDYQSIMHYGPTFFSKNDQATIKVIGNVNATIGQRDGLSNTDIIKINSLYSCHVSALGWSPWSSYTPCSLTCIKQRQRYCFSSDPSHCPGASAYGIETQQTTCPDSECHAPIDGHWGRWSAWSACSKSCDIGIKLRIRICSDPPPANNGRHCEGNATEAANCMESKTCRLGPDDCDFTGGQHCHWVSSSTRLEYQWQTHAGRTSSIGTGPNGDHSTGSDYYIYTEASAPARDGNRAVLTSREFSSNQCRCMTWFYHMFGVDVKELNVFVHPDGQARRKIWSRVGEQGQEWKFAEANIPNDYGTNYTVQFESVRGYSYLGDIALDDIHFKENVCGVEPLGCYKDSSLRALPVLTANLRNDIDWADLQKTVNQCACIAYNGGYKYFGECWASKTDVNYGVYGASSDCSNGVGHHWTNFVYTFKD